MTNDQQPIASLSRRQLAAAMLAAGAPLALASNALAMEQSKAKPQAAAPAAEKHDHAAMGPMNKLVIGMVLFPGLTPIDLVGPHLAMQGMMNTEVHVVWKNMEPVRGDSGLTLMPSGTFADCPKDLDILCVPGGPRGTENMLKDDEFLDFIADRGSRAKYVTSVCTGSLLLGAAGLLKGYKANSWWATREILPVFGAIPVEGHRVVADRNRITGGGVTAGLDFGLYLTGLLRGEDMGRLQELIFEYNPQPPFGAGSPTLAPPATLAMAKSMLGPTVASIRKAGEIQAAKRIKA
jgi:cyclohexyl-isocyanide hydratase